MTLGRVIFAVSKAREVAEQRRNRVGAGAFASASGGGCSMPPTRSASGAVAAETDKESRKAASLLVG
ncbi:MAG TPA: hypothetical protein VGI27_12705, partial [Solirubrobacteraceae bacterium]